MSEKASIPGTVEAWESEELGADEKSVRVVDADRANQIDDALCLQLISIRLDKNVIDTFKLIAQFHGVGYQPLMRDALKRFAESETKSILFGIVQSQKQKSDKPKKGAATPPKNAALKKAA